MDQKIGIVFQSTGASKVMNDLRRMARSMDSLAKSAGMLDRSMGKGSLANVNMTNIAAQTTKLSAGLREARREAGMLERAMNRIRGVGAIGGGVGFGGSGKPGKGQSMSQGPGGMGAWGFMGRWWIGYMAAAKAKQLGTDIGMAKSREPLLGGLRDLSAVGFDENQRRKAELASANFIKQWPLIGKTSDMLNSLAEVASAIDVNSPMFKGKGVQALTRINEAGAIMGGVSQLGPNEASKLLMAATHSQLFQMSKAEQAKYNSGEKSITSLAESTAAKIAKTIKITSIWGTDVQNFLNYSLPSALSKGWSMDTILGLAGTLRTAGIKGQKAGRGMRAIMESQVDRLAKLSIAGEANPAAWDEFKTLKGEEKDKRLQEATSRINERMSKDQYALFEDVGTWLDRAKQRKIDPVRALGLSQNWIGQMRLMGGPGFGEKWHGSAQQLGESTTLEEARSFLASAQKDPGYMSKRLSDAVERFEQSSGRKSPIGGMVDSWVSALDMMSDYQNSGNKFNYATAVTEVYDFVAHGFVGGLMDVTKNIGVGVLQSIGLVSKNYTPPSIEGLLVEQEKLHGSIYKGVSDMIEKARQSIIGMNKRITGLGTDIGGYVGKLNPANWFTPTPGLRMGKSVIPEVNALPKTPNMVGMSQPLLSAPGIGGQAPINVHIEAPERPINLDARVLIDDKEIGRAVAEYRSQQRMQDGEAFTPSLAR